MAVGEILKVKYNVAQKTTKKSFKELRLKNFSSQNFMNLLMSEEPTKYETLSQLSADLKLVTADGEFVADILDNVIQLADAALREISQKRSEAIKHLENAEEIFLEIQESWNLFEVMYEAARSKKD